MRTAAFWAKSSRSLPTTTSSTPRRRWSSCRKRSTRASASSRKATAQRSAAIEDFVQKYNDRNPGKEVLYFNYAAVDPVLTNDKCSYWHFRWDANSDIKMNALTNYIKPRANIKKVYLINQDYWLERGANSRRAKCSTPSGRTSRSSATRCIPWRRSPTSRPTSPRSKPPAPTALSPATGVRISPCCSRPPPTPDCRSTGTPTTPGASAARQRSSRRTLQIDVSDFRGLAERVVCTGPGVREGVSRQARYLAVLSARR